MGAFFPLQIAEFPEPLAVDRQAVIREIRAARNDNPDPRHGAAIEAVKDAGGAVDFIRTCTCGFISKPHTARVAAELDRCPVLTAERERTANAKAYGHRVNLGLMGLVK